MLREILKEDSNNFKLFCNSFLIEASKKEIELKYRCISFNNMRKAKYRLLTRIGEEFVSKQEKKLSYFGYFVKTKKRNP